MKEYSRLFVGILNEYDLISSKLIRGTAVDFDDCLMLVKSMGRRIDMDRLVRHFLELSSFDIAENRLSANMDSFMLLLRKENVL